MRNITARLIARMRAIGCPMQTPTSDSIRTDFDVYVLKCLIERLVWAYNAGKMELVRSDLRCLGDALKGSSQEPATWAIDEWLREQAQEIA